ncbi:MAG: TIGR01777 family protein [Anaerolineae bacterium]|nr:TIGR01777 family protein [Anaerolineae bacterium]
MKIGITGGSGLIGSALTDHAVEHSHEVVIFSRGVRTTGTGKAVTFRPWDPTKRKLDNIDDLDIIINLAGSTLAAFPWNAKRKQVIRASRVESGLTIVEALSKISNKPKVLFQASAIGYYGTSEESEFTESSPLGSDFLSGVCRDWEASTEPVEAMGIRRVIGRIGLVLHPSAGFLPKLKMMTNLLLSGPMGTGRQWYSWIHIDDLVQAVFHTIENERYSGAINLTASNPVHMDEFGKTLAKVLRKPYWLPIPKFAFQLLLGEMSTLLLDGQKVIPSRLLEGGFDYRYGDLELALRDIYK